jgi:hypothetical protein
MCITEIKTGWWKLVSEGEADTDTLVFFGYSKGEVVGKLNNWIRRKELEKWR